MQYTLPVEFSMVREGQKFRFRADNEPKRHNASYVYEKTGVGSAQRLQSKEKSVSVPCATTVLVDPENHEKLGGSIEGATRSLRQRQEGFWNGETGADKDKQDVTDWLRSMGCK